MDKFNVGDRCCFQWKYGMIEFGNVVKIDHDGEQLLIMTNNGNVYQAWSSAVVKLSKEKKG